MMKLTIGVLAFVLAGCAMPQPQLDATHGAMAARFSTLTTSVTYIILAQPGSCVAQPDGVIACTIEK